MKKIFAILISLLFVASTFGVASVMAPPPPCECQIIGPDYVRVGDTFQVEIKTIGSCGVGFLVESPIAKLIEKEITPDGYILTYEALGVGNIHIASCGPTGDEFNYFVTILPKELPMNQIMKILEKNKNK
jgi:hypothetical protein